MQATQTRHLVDPRSLAALVLGAVIFATGVLLGAVIDVSSSPPAAVGAPATTVLGDHRYDAIEEIRATR
jgi:hypothetical protein